MVLRMDNEVASTWVRCLTFIVLFLNTASADDLCLSDRLADSLNVSYVRGAVPSDGVPTEEAAAETPVDCAMLCCRQPLCSAIYFFNETCFLVQCYGPDNNGDACTFNLSDQFVDSYWLLLREHQTESSSSSSLLEAPTSTSISSNSTLPTATVPAPSSSPWVESECTLNSSNCKANEKCSAMIVDSLAKFFCKCVAGYHRDELTKSCVQDVITQKPSSTVISTKPLINGGVNATSSTTTPTLPPPVAPAESLVVSAGDEHVIRWPQNDITINAFVLPSPDNSSKPNYQYQWSLFAHPEGTETGQMFDLNSASLKLSKLRIGTYTFKVSVSADGKYGESYVNITVLPPERENQGPIAVAKPSYQEINQPNDLIIDGSGSTDDDKITHYHWELVSGPMDSSNIDPKEMEKSTLVLKGLGPGSYRFKLTVTDSNGVQNDTYANAVVIKETDYPPKANAGSNIIINLPLTSVTLMGNASTDDKGIISYEWTKKSDDKLTADMLGVRTPFLQLANLQVGDYTFTLTVTDTAKQTSSADVHVFVKPERNQAPVSRAGADRVVWLPIDSLTLDGSNSTDDQKIVSFAWSLVSGVSTPVITNADQAVATVSKLLVGEYKFRLVVKDNEGLESTSQVVITVKENPNRAPVARAGGDQIVVLPSSLVVINGSSSTDDKGIVTYLWTREKNSPAAGDVVPMSDRQALLQLVNVVSGRYKFILTVTDAEGLESHDSMTLDVRPDPFHLNLVELYLSVDISSFTENNQMTLKDQLSLLLRKSSSAGEPNIVTRSLTEDVATGRTLIVFYVESTNKDGREPWPATEVVRTLKKLRSSLSVLEIQIAKFEPLVCQNNCSGHGICDQLTKTCICDGFWMEDFFKSYFGDQETNCDWSVLYVVIIVFFGVVAVGGGCWAIFCYCKRYRCSYLKPKPKRHRYSIESPSVDSFQTNEEMQLIPKLRPVQNSSLMQSDSDFSSEELLFIKSKRTANGFAKNGSAVSGAKPKITA